MDWSKRTVSEKLDVKEKTVNNIMQWYYRDALIVNRKYQRKLVWSLDEKRLFIDSIINKYPTPSIILSSYEEKDENGEIQDHYEIIDGLQRLNAIVSFVNNEFGIIIEGEEYYYDLGYTPDAVTLRNNNELRQKEKVLPDNMSQYFASAELPIIITVQRGERDTRIEKIFERINSTGRKLSAHDIRQASSAGAFPDLVRRVAESIRGDFTFYNNVVLRDMPQISLSSEGLDYKIKPENTFWRKHDILPYKNFRQSKDEEVIAASLALALLGWDFRINYDSLNSLYRPGTKRYTKINEAVEQISKDCLEGYARDVISDIDTIFGSVNSNFTEYLYPKKDMAGKDVSFIMLFCTIYRLNRESYFIEDYPLAAKTLKRSFESTFALVSSNSSNIRRIEVMDVLYNSMKSIMVAKVPRQRNDDDKLLEKLLSLSNIESQMVEFKIGVSYFENGKLNHKELRKIFCTLVAMANTKCRYQEEGFVIVGIANNEQSYKNWNSIHNETPLIYGEHLIVGINKEATTHFTDVDYYTRKIGDLIKESEISEPLKEYVLQNYRAVEFRGKTLVLLPTVAQKTPSTFDGKFYVREGSKTIPQKGIL